MPSRLLLFVALPLCVLPGCATHPVDQADSYAVNPKRLLADYAFYDHPVHHGAKLLVIRDVGRLDEPESAQIIVDGHAISYLKSRERIEVYVYAGERILSVGSKPGFFAAPLVSHAFTFKAGRTYLVRVGIRGGQFDIGPAVEVRNP